MNLVKFSNPAGARVTARARRNSVKRGRLPPKPTMAERRESAGGPARHLLTLHPAPTREFYPGSLLFLLQQRKRLSGLVPRLGLRLLFLDSTSRREWQRHKPKARALPRVEIRRKAFARAAGAG